MEKFDSKRHLKYFKYLPFSFFSSISYLDFIGYMFDRNGEHILVWQDILYPHDFPSIFLPQNKLNWERCSVALATLDDIEKIKKEKIEILVQRPIITEFFYATKDCLNPTGNVRKEVNRFVKNYNYKILYSYPKKSTIEFYKFWKEQRSRVSPTVQEEEEFFYFCLENLEKYSMRQIYIEIDGKLIGLAWGEPHWKGNGVGLQLKVNYAYKGLSRFLWHEYAKLFGEFEIFTAGGSAHDEGITRHKRKLGPIEEKQYHYLLTANKKV